MKKIYLSLVALSAGSIAIGQQGVMPKGVEQLSEPAHIKAKFEKANASVDAGTRATTIERWIDFTDAYSAVMGSTPSNTSISNGAFTNDTNIAMDVDGDIDSAFLFSSYSVIHLGGKFYSDTWFNPNLQPFDPATDITIDSALIWFNYKKVDASTVDTAVIRFAVPGGTQMTQTGYWLGGFNLHPVTGDSVNFLFVEYDTPNEKIGNTVAEVKIPLTDALLSDSNNWGSDSTFIFLQRPVGEVISGHSGFLATEVSVIYGRQYVSGVDTIGVNANWFAPVFRAVDQTQAPIYNEEDLTVGGTLNRFGREGGLYYNHWVQNNSLAFPQDGLDPFQSPYYSLKIQQSNNLTADVKELDNGAKLYQNYPNPTNGLTSVVYELPSSANVTFEVMDITGKVVVSSFEGSKPAGKHLLELNTNDLRSGVYFYSINVNGNKLTKKMTITK